ncbi:recombinase family protein [Streptomyces sp. NPDC005148]
MKTSTGLTPEAVRRIVYCFIYARISQDREGAHYGTDRQTEDCYDLAARLSTPQVEYRVIRVFVDNDLSAYSGKPRKDYLEMFKCLEDDQATVVLSWHTDRLHRSPTELEAYIELSERKGVSTHTVQAGHIDLSTPSGRMTARILGAVARQESEHKGHRVARARLQKAKAGKWGGGLRPFGWGVPTGETKKKTVKGSDEEIDAPVLDMDKAVPEEAEALKVGTRLILTGGSVREWVRWLADKGLLSTTGKAIEHQAARDLLLRPRNAGLAVYQGEEVGRGEWDEIVPEPDFRAVVAILTNPSRVSTPGPTPKWFGSLIYQCGHEGCTLPVKCTRTGGGNHPSYRCPDQHGGGRKAEVLDKFIADLIIERLSQPDAGDLLLPAADGVDVAALQMEAEEIKRRMTELADAFTKGLITMVQLADGSATAQADLESIQRKIASAAKTDPLVGLVGAKDVGKVWEGLPLNRRRTILKTLLKVTLRPPRRGRMPDGGYFDFDAVETEWLR